MGVDQPGAGERLRAELVFVPEQLVAAAYGEHHRTPAGRRMQRLTFALEQVPRAQELIAVLTAAHVIEIGAVALESGHRSPHR